MHTHKENNRGGAMAPPIFQNLLNKFGVEMFLEKDYLLLAVAVGTPNLKILLSSLGNTNDVKLIPIQKINSFNKLNKV